MDKYSFTDVNDSNTSSLSGFTGGGSSFDANVTDFLNRGGSFTADVDGVTYVFAKDPNANEDGRFIAYPEHDPSSAFKFVDVDITDNKIAIYLDDTPGATNYHDGVESFTLIFNPQTGEVGVNVDRTHHDGVMHGVWRNGTPTNGSTSTTPTNRSAPPPPEIDYSSQYLAVLLVSVGFDETQLKTLLDGYDIDLDENFLASLPLEEAEAYVDENDITLTGFMQTFLDSRGTDEPPPPLWGGKEAQENEEVPSNDDDTQTTS